MYFKNFANITEDFIKNNYPEYYNELFSFVKENNIKISERVYLFQNNMINKPKCINCDNNVNFIKFSIGYRNFCSKKCAALYTHKNPEIKEKRIKSLFVSNNNPDIRKNMTNKLINTISEYSEEKKLNIVDKRKSTVLNKYGVDNISKDKNINDIKSKKTKLTMINVNFNKTFKKVKECGYTLISIVNDFLNIHCEKCNNNFLIKKYLFNKRLLKNNTICIHCNKLHGKSNFEYKIYEYIKENYNGEIITNYNKWKKFQIDIYLPKLNLGIECNGLWWHSEVYRNENYHFEKFKFFKEKNIRILNIWEDEFLYECGNIKTKLFNNLNNIHNNIYSEIIENGEFVNNNLEFVEYIKPKLFYFNKRKIKREECSEENSKFIKIWNSGYSKYKLMI